MRPSRVLLLAVLGFGVLAVSSAALLVRLADAPALSTAALRMVFASGPALAVLPLSARRDRKTLGGDGLRGLLLAGLCLAFHFATWIASLELTTVASSVTLVTTSPMFVAAYLVLTGKRIASGTVLGMLLCLAGGLIIGYADLLRGPRAVEGDLLALAGAGFAGAYFVLGKRARADVATTTYIGIVYPIAALALLLLTVAVRQPLSGFSSRTWLMLLLMAVGPQLLGHSSLNWAVGYLSAPLVTIAVLGEPVIASALAWLFLGELPRASALLGAVILLVGVYAGIRGELRAQAPASSEVEERTLRTLPDLH